MPQWSTELNNHARYPSAIADAPLKIPVWGIDVVHGAQNTVTFLIMGPIWPTHFQYSATYRAIQ